MLRSNKLQTTTIIVIVAFSVIMLATVTIMTMKNTRELKDILESSVKAQLISVSVAAREVLDINAFEKYNSLEDAQDDWEHYQQTLSALRKLQQEVGAQYIYALKQMNGKYYFIFDTDPEDEEVFIEYELSAVHEQAFIGRESADIMNVDDIYGSYNTGAVPVWKDGRVIGIICTDIADAYIENGENTALRNSAFLIVAVTVSMAIMLTILVFLMNRVKKMQDKISRMANYDTLTGLPNRQCLMEYLEKITSSKKTSNEPFALYFIDLDNFKTVNDSAGHDAGDELLRHIASYLDTIHGNAGQSKSFRPAAGILNVSARIGGDEFLQIVPGVNNETDAAIIAQKMLDNFNSQALSRYIEKYKVGLSIGAALYNKNTDNFNVLIKYADIAMYHAKRGGKNGYRVYNEDMAQKDEK